MHPLSTPTTRAAARAIILAAGAALSACASSTPESPADSRARANLDQPTSETQVADASSRLEQMFDSLGHRRGSTSRDLDPFPSNDPWGNRGRTYDAPSSTSTNTPAPPANPEPAEPLPPAPVGPPQPIDPTPTTPPPPPDLLAALESLTTNAALPAPLAEAYRLAIAEALNPTSARARLDSARAALDPADAARLDAFSSLLAAFLNSSEADESLVRTLTDQAAALTPAPTLRLPAALLVKRVDGFGRFTPFDSTPNGPTRFLAGRAHPVLVYVEVAGFTSTLKPPTLATGSREPEWVIDLTQELRLFHDADGVLAWHSRPQPARDGSRRQRTDHYLVQRITLPATLTIGAYNLKVIIRDAGHNSATAEAVIPFQLVADPSLIGR